MAKDTTSDKIEAWLAGELPEAEARAFEAHIAANPALAAEVESHRTAQEALARLAEQSIQANFARWRETLDKLPPPPTDEHTRIHRFMWLLVLQASFILTMEVWNFISQRGTPPGQIEQNATPSDPAIEIEKTQEPESQPSNPAPPAVKKVIKPVPAPKYIALVEENLNDYRDNVAGKYGQTMGSSDNPENAAFEEGVRAFLENKGSAAQKALLQVPKSDSDHFAPAQEMLAWLYFREGKYAEAAACYEVYARGLNSADTDWVLLQFYLADYNSRRASFDKLLNEILNPDNEHKHQSDAKELKARMGTKRK